MALWRSSHGISSHFIQMKSCSTLRNDNLLHNQLHNPQDYYSPNYHHTCHHHSHNHNHNHHLYQQTNFSHEAEYCSSSEQSHLHRRSCQTHSRFSRSQSSDEETSSTKKTINNNDRSTVRSSCHANKNLIKSPQKESICTYCRQHNKLPLPLDNQVGRYKRRAGIVVLQEFKIKD